MGAHLGIPLVPVLHPPQIPTVFLSVGEEGDEVGNTDNIHAAPQPIAEVHQRRQCHVAAIATSHHGHAGWIEPRIGPDPIEECADVLDRIFAQKTVIQGEEPFSVAGRPTDIRNHQSNAQLVQKIIVASHESGPRLGFGAAVDNHHHRPLPREPRGIRTIDKRADLQLVETRDRDQLWLTERVSRQPAGFALGPASQAAGFDVHRVGVGGRLGVGQAETQISTILMPLQTGHHPGRNTGHGPDLPGAQFQER